MGNLDWQMLSSSPSQILGSRLHRLKLVRGRLDTATGFSEQTDSLLIVTVVDVILGAFDMVALEVAKGIDAYPVVPLALSQGTLVHV